MSRLAHGKYTETFKLIILKHFINPKHLQEITVWLFYWVFDFKYNRMDIAQGTFIANEMVKACSGRPGFQEKKKKSVHPNGYSQSVLTYTHILWFHIPEKNQQNHPIWLP